MSAKDLADQYKVTGRPVKVRKGKHVGYGSKLAKSETKGGVKLLSKKNIKKTTKV